VHPAHHRFVIDLYLRYHHDLGTGTDTGPHRDKPAVTPHYFDDEYPIVRFRRVTDFIDRGSHGVDSGIVANGKIRTQQIVIDGTRQAYDGEIKLLGKHARSGKSPIATNHD